jgi:putative ABC transport system substrate-binding protein
LQHSARASAETGFSEGRNVAIKYRWAYSQLDRLPELAADLVRRRVAVVAAWSGALAARTVKAASPTIPIVFQMGEDPVEIGLVASLNRPGGNATGMTSMSAEILAKRLELLHKIVPQAKRIALLATITSDTEPMIKGAQAAATSLGLQIEVFSASIRSGD